MSYPRRKDLFTAWSKAMVEGATVDKPNYPGTRGTTNTRRKARSARIRKNRKKRKKKNLNG